MVTAKIIYAQEMGIDVSVEINQPLDRVNMDIIDLVRILGIFLDNAIEAALETDTPKMSFVIIQEDKETVFFMTNSFIDHHLQISELSRAGTSSISFWIHIPREIPLCRFFISMHEILAAMSTSL